MSASAIAQAMTVTAIPTLAEGIREGRPERPLASPSTTSYADPVPEPGTLALDLTCAECGRSPRAGETWRILFADRSPGRP